MFFRLPVIFFLLLATACSTQKLVIPQASSVYQKETGEIQDCAELFVEFDELVRKQGVMDVQASRIEGFPYLRADRFLASFKSRLQQDEALHLWLERLRELDYEARLIELRNLDFDADHLAGFSVSDKRALAGKLGHCGGLLINTDLKRKGQIQKLINNVEVKDNYNEFSRVLGFYPVSRLFVAKGVDQLHEEIKATFQQQKSQTANHSLIYYYPEPDDSGRTWTRIAGLLQTASNNPLAIPLLDKDSEEVLFSRYAPVWAIEQKSNDDKIGKPYWDENGKLDIDTETPITYRFLSYTKLDEEILLQLNYVIWFPARPVTGPLDILGGKLDGITWRVTLNKGGKPLIYDAMHNCGCYHMFFPSPNLERRDIGYEGEEPILVPDIVQEIKPDQRAVIHIASSSHYIEGVRLISEDKTDYTIYSHADYQELRSLTYGDNRYKSMFAENGIVAGTSRKERFILWPMGVMDPGAMRQMGHHAIAFVGKRHFDDPDLIERYFKLISAKIAPTNEHLSADLH